jgi:ubiquinone/menaquinone biosynthesis C-methylase UbiE
MVKSNQNKDARGKEHRFIKVTTSKDEVRRRYAKLSRVYDFWGILTESKAATRALKLAAIKNGENILEVAVGTGSLFEKIVSINKDGRNEGVDLSPEMLEIARKRLSRKHSNYTLKVADAYALPYPESTFDLVMNSYMFDLLPEKDFSLVLAEFKRVLKPGGRMVITTMTQGQKWYSRFWDWLIRKAPNILEGCRPIALSLGVKQAGFRNVREEYVSQLTFPSLVVCAERPAQEST